MTDERPTSAVRSQPARLQELNPEGALRGDDQGETADFAIFDNGRRQRQLQRRPAHGVGDFDGAFYRSLRHRYMHRTCTLTPTSTTVSMLYTTMHRDAL
jgi:hypothetical protein